MTKLQLESAIHRSIIGSRRAKIAAVAVMIELDQEFAYNTGS